MLTIRQRKENPILHVYIIALLLNLLLLRDKDLLLLHSISRNQIFVRAQR